MISGLHAIIYTKQADKLRAFFHDVVKLPSVDAGHGWLIFAAPPAELAVHPDGESRHELFLMCDDVRATVAELRSKDVELTMPITDQGWGLLTRLRLPSGDEIGLYQPKHPTAIAKVSKPATRTSRRRISQTRTARRKNAPQKQSRRKPTS